MTLLAFDTFAAVTRLKSAGFTEPQAKEIIDTFKAVDTSQIATAGDIKDVRSDLHALDLKLTAEITLLKWMMGLVIAGILALLLKSYFPH